VLRRTGERSTPVPSHPPFAPVSAGSLRVARIFLRDFRALRAFFSLYMLPSGARARISLARLWNIRSRCSLRGGNLQVNRTSIPTARACGSCVCASDSSVLWLLPRLGLCAWHRAVTVCFLRHLRPCRRPGLTRLDPAMPRQSRRVSLRQSL
jgi:hypothetical protein